MKRILFSMVLLSASFLSTISAIHLNNTSSTTEVGIQYAEASTGMTHFNTVTLKPKETAKIPDTTKYIRILAP